MLNGSTKVGSSAPSIKACRSTLSNYMNVRASVRHEA